MLLNQKNKEENNDFDRVLNPVPGLRELIEKDKIEPGDLAIGFSVGDDGKFIIEDRSKIVLLDRKNPRHIEWKVDSLRALFRGTKNPPPDHEMAHYPDEYVSLFYGIERYVHTLCSIKRPYPFDEQFIEVYSI
jgi:hypothetical protein